MWIIFGQFGGINFLILAGNGLCQVQVKFENLNLRYWLSRELLQLSPVYRVWYLEKAEIHTEMAKMALLSGKS